MWKFVADGYEVSTDGQVRSWKSGAPKILKPQLNASGYLQVQLCIDGKPKGFRIHRLVAEAFIPNPDGKPCVNHISGVKTDNRVENLEWCTPHENNIHAYATGLRPQSENNTLAKLTNTDVCYIRDNPDGLTCQALADKFGVGITTISLIQRGKIYKVAGGKIRDNCVVSANVRDEIRRLYVRGSHNFSSRALARQFNVSQSTILNIVHEVSGDV